jgi:hypothetical protein
MKQIERIKKTKDANRAAILAIPGVIGCGIGIKFKNGKPTTELSLQVFVTAKNPNAAVKVPASYTNDDGTVISTDVIELGEVKFTGFTGTYRPAKPGAAMSNVSSAYAGTFGAVVTDNTDGQTVILSASHTLANFNNAAIGSKILQTSTQYGGSSPANDYATLKRFVPLNLGAGGINSVDAAICTPNSTSNNWVSSTSFCSPIKVTKQCAVGLLYAAGSAYTIVNPIQAVQTELNITVPKTTQASLNMSVHFCSAYTGYVSTQVTSIMADVYVSYQGQLILWEDQILLPTSIANAAAGDSGAVVYTTFNC